MTNTAHVNGMEMHYEIRGDGEPLVLLHGFTGIGGDWGTMLEALEPGHKLIVPDLRGHGRSNNPSPDFTQRQCALDVFALLDRLKIERIKAMGLSLGGNTLLHIATQQPGRVDAMVLVSATSYFPAQARAIMAQFTLDDWTEAQREAARRRHVLGDEQIRKLWAHGRGLKDSYDDMNFTPPLLSTIKARTLIVHGDRDPLYPCSLAVEMHNAIPNSHLWVVPNGGHGPVFGNLTPAFVKTALEFLRGDWDKQ